MGSTGNPDKIKNIFILFCLKQLHQEKMTYNT